VHACLVAVQSDVELQRVGWHPGDGHALLLQKRVEPRHAQVVQRASARPLLFESEPLLPQALEVGCGPRKLLAAGHLAQRLLDETALRAFVQTLQPGPLACALSRAAVATTE